jgi:hypothetical protein
VTDPETAYKRVEIAKNIVNNFWQNVKLTDLNEKDTVLFFLMYEKLQKFGNLSEHTIVSVISNETNSLKIEIDKRKDNKKS